MNFFKEIALCFVEGFFLVLVFVAWAVVHALTFHVLGWEDTWNSKPLILIPALFTAIYLHWKIFR